PPCNDHSVGDRMIGARIDLRARIDEFTAMSRDLRAQSPAQPEPARRIQQVVAAVKTKAQRKGGNQEGPRFLVQLGWTENALLVGREKFGAVGPGPSLLPDEIALPLDIAAEPDRLGLISIELLVTCRGLQVQDLVTLQEIAAPELHCGELLLG